jgi:hypothetical protein
MEWFNTPIDSPLLIALTAVYFVLESIGTFDIRLIQAKRRGDIPADAELLPQWTGFLIYISWGIFIFMVLLNWKYALAVWVIRFILKVLPVLETIGNLLMRPFKGKGYRGRL